MKYSREMLAAAAAQSRNVMDVLTVLGLKKAGGTHSHISKRLRDLEIDTSHFLGQASNKGRPPWNRMPVTSVLVRLPDGSAKPKTIQLRRALIESGRKEQCGSCGLGTMWNGLPLHLEIDHIDGEWLNNTPENLRFLCPNCHAQTPNYCRIKTVSIVRDNKCIDCNQVIAKHSKRCRQCAGPHKNRKIDWPPDRELLTMIKNTNVLEIARTLNVSRGAVTRRLAKITTAA